MVQVIVVGVVHMLHSLIVQLLLHLHGMLVLVLRVSQPPLRGRLELLVVRHVIGALEFIHVRRIHVLLLIGHISLIIHHLLGTELTL